METRNLGALLEHGAHMEVRGVDGKGDDSTRFRVY